MKEIKKTNFVLLFIVDKTEKQPPQSCQNKVRICDYLIIRSPTAVIINKLLPLQYILKIETIK